MQANQRRHRRGLAAPPLSPVPLPAAPPPPDADPPPSAAAPLLERLRCCVQCNLQQMK